MSNIYSATEMLAALTGGNFTPALAVTCAIKHEEKDNKHLLINLKMSCADWIPVPVESIDTLEYIRTFICDDHSHPIVRLTFAKPKTAEAQALAAIAMQQTELRAQNTQIRPFDFTACANCLNTCSVTHAPGGDRVTCYNNCTSCGHPQ
jgi:hypothetical protein